MLNQLKTASKAYPLTRGPRAHFFGYYDVCPWDADNRLLLALEVDETGRFPGAEDIGSVGIVDTHGTEGRIVPLGETCAWNWQMAARQQWFDDRHVIYNDRVKGRFVARVVDSHARSIDTLDHAVWSLSSDRRVAVAPSFERLYALYRTYGYAGVACPGADIVSPSDDGLYIIDIGSGERRLLMSIAELSADYAKRDSVTPGCGYVLAHPTLNPAGSHVAFFLRHVTRTGFLYSRLFSVGVDGKDLQLLEEELVSHFAWLDDRRLMVFARGFPLLAAARRIAQNNPVAGGLLSAARMVKRQVVRAERSDGAGHARIDGRFFAVDISTRSKECIGVDVLVEDGHNSVSPDGHWIALDTYPDRESMQALLLYNLDTGTRYDITTLQSDPALAGSEARCDLHPRWDRTGERICIDSTHLGARQIFQVNVNTRALEQRASS